MTRSESITHLATALAKAQEEMPVAVFDATNPFLKSKYASLGSVIQASRPILAKHKLSIVQFPVGDPLPACGHPLPSDGRGVGPAGRTNGTEGSNGNAAPHPASGHLLPSAEKAAHGDGRLGDYIGVESILMHESGEFVSERIVIPLTEEKGKTKVQCAGSTLTYLRRYSWAAILGMYSDEDSDGCLPHGPTFPRQLKPTTALPLPPPPMKQRQSN
jgi:hypothetical protein